MSDEHLHVPAGAATASWEQLIADSRRPATPGDHETDKRLVVLNRSEFDKLYTAAEERGRQAAPLPMILYCPACGTQHVDAPEAETGWTNPPHRSHICHGCKVIWRPADVATVGVAVIATQGKSDTFDGNHITRQAGVREGIEMAAQLLVSRAAWFPLHTIYNYNGKIMRDELLANAKLIRAILPAAPNTANEKQRAPAGDAIEQGINDAITMIRALLPTAPKEG